MSDVIPEGWNKLEVQSAFEIGRGRVISKPEIRENPGPYPVYSSQSKDNGRMGAIGSYDFEGEYITWTTDGAYAGTVFHREGKFNCTNVCGTLKDKGSFEVYPRFVASYLGTVAKNHVSYVGNPKLMNGTFAEIEFLLPPLPEQQKIAAILSSVDEVIEKTQAQIEKLKDLKTGMMQELLSPREPKASDQTGAQASKTNGLHHTEFKDSPLGRIPVGWDVVKFDDVLDKIDSGWSPSCIEVPPSSGEWGVLKVSAVTRGKFLESQSKTLPENLEPKTNIRVRAGDILLTRANGVADLVGKCVMINQEPKSKLMMSDKILRLKPNNLIFDEFLLHTFNSQVTRRQIELSWGGSSGQKNIGQADIKNYRLALPPYNEQKIIAKSISQIDNLLNEKSRKRDSLSGLKKALMQDLLTGKLRVSVN